MVREEGVRLKRRVFGLESKVIDSQIYRLGDRWSENEDIDTGRFRLEEVLELMARLNGQDMPAIFRDGRRPADVSELDNTFFTIGIADAPPAAFLYELSEGAYYLYKRNVAPIKTEEVKIYAAQEDEKKLPNLYIPTGIVIRAVPHETLGDGVLGRAFIQKGYIEILDSLFGAEFFEVLTHELFHLRFPEYSEVRIRMITKEYVGETTYH